MVMVTVPKFAITWVSNVNKDLRSQGLTNNNNYLYYNYQTNHQTNLKEYNL